MSEEEIMKKLDKSFEKIKQNIIDMEKRVIEFGKEIEEQKIRIEKLEKFWENEDEG